jgi:hypothetical protein
MLRSLAIDDLTESELLLHVGSLAREQRSIEARILRSAVRHAHNHGPQTLDPAEAMLPGHEQARRLAGHGTPKVAEFAPAEFAARLGLSSYAGRELIADALDLAHRLPRLWHRVRALQVKASHARFVARKTRDLPLDQAGFVDERVAEYSDGRVSWSRFETLVEAAIKAADPEAAAAEEAAVQDQFARATRSDEHGMRGFYIRAPFAVIARLEATVAFLAEALRQLGDQSPADQLRVKAILILANPAQAVELLAAYAAWKDRPADPAVPDEPDRNGDRPELDWSKLLPTVTVFLHLAADRESDPIARVEGSGPVTEAWVRKHLGPHARFTLRPVLDLAGQAPVDAYEIPERHRQAVHLMTPADTFPFSSSIRRSHQIDHTEPYRHGVAAEGAGQSRLGNYGPMTTAHHRIKTFGGWAVKQPFPGIYVWRDPHGALYLVDHTGTRALSQAAAGPNNPPRVDYRHFDLLELAA